MVEQQASTETADTEESTASEKTALEIETVDPAKYKQLLDDHSQQGRELKAERLRASSAVAKAAQFERENEEARYGLMNEEDKTKYRQERAAVAKDAPKVAQTTNERDLLRILAQTEDPKITKALSALYWRAEERSSFPDKEQVLAIVEGLTPDDEEEPEAKPKTKGPPAVTAVRGTRATEPSADEEVTAAEKSLRAKDGKFTYGELLGLRAARDATKRAAAR
jgi:hypothetical protein